MFLSSAAEAHISEDSRAFLQSLEACDCPALSACMAMIRGRSVRLVRVVQGEVGDNPDHYSPEQTREIDSELLKLRDKCTPRHKIFTLKLKHYTCLCLEFQSQHLLLTVSALGFEYTCMISSVTLIIVV